MNNDILRHLTQHFYLGIPKLAPERIFGGLLHIMWRLDTDKGSYVIKQLSKNIDLTNECIIKNYELSESIASRFFALGIPAVPAFENNGQYLFMENGTGYLVYPWVDAKALDQHAVSEMHALKIAAILAQMHCLNLDEPRMAQPEFYTHTTEKIIELIDKAENFNCSFVNNLKKHKDNILFAHEAYQNAIPALKTHLVISHGDLDQKNVLWDSSGYPKLIDWEAVCKINSTYDIINTAFYWSGITSHFNNDLFFKMIDMYEAAGGIINKEQVVSACYGVFSWIGWLVYNIERSCVLGNSEEKAMGIEQVNQTLSTILRLQTVMPEIIKIIEGKL